MTTEPPVPAGPPGSGWAPPPPPEPVTRAPGWPVQAPPGDWSAPGYAPPRRNGPGIASFFLAVVALVGALFVWPGFVIGAVALALGLIGRGRVDRGEADARGVATMGAALGGLAVALSVAWGAVIYFAGERAQDDYETCVRGGGDDARPRCIDEFDPPRP